MADRPTIEVTTPPGGWGAPWPNVAEIEVVLPHDSWTLVGGLMTQLHGIHAGIGVVRPTNDVDLVLHVETTRGVAAATASVYVGAASQRNGCTASLVWIARLRHASAKTMLDTCGHLWPDADGSARAPVGAV